MASWGDVKLFSCILFITCCCYCTVTFAQVPVDCCLSVKNQTLDKRGVVDYRRQISGEGCFLDSTIFVSRQGRKLCVPADESWVEDLMRHVDFLKKFCKKHNYKGKRCFGVKRE